MKAFLLLCATGIMLTTQAHAELEVVAYTGPDIQQLICNSKSDHTNLRSAPSAKDSTVYQTLKNGDQVEINGTVTNDAGALWYEVTWAADDGDVMGYVIASAVRPSCQDAEIIEAANEARTPLVSPTTSLVEPGTCELIVAGTNTLEEAKTLAATIPDKRYLKIFELENGGYAISIGSLKPEEEEAVLASWKANGKIPSSAFCSKGALFVSGMKWNEAAPVANTASNNDVGPYGEPNLLGPILQALSGATGVTLPSSGGTVYTGVTPDEAITSDQEVGVKVDGDGWVSENGREIGRVNYSYGYWIICSNGYNDGYGSDSAFGKSFKVDVGGMDEAVGVLLSACKR